jgi:methionyl-tRNA formyltransferase
VRTVYLGTSAFAAAVLERLADSAHRPQLVVTRPDRPRGRGRSVSPPPVAETARALGLEVIQPEDVNAPDVRERIAAADPDALALCAYGAIVSEPLLSDLPIFNVHPSLLPRWRGAAPIERAIMAGDDLTGVSIMRLVAALDAGPVCLAAQEPIHADDTYGTLAARLEDLGARLLVQALDEVPPWVEQPEEGLTYAERITAEDRTLDPGRPAIENERIVRALAPHIGARVALEDGSWLGVLRARVAPEGGGPAELVPTADGRLVLGGLELLEVRPAGGRPMDASAYLRGRATS